MKILVLGGGVVGVTTAFELQNDGHEVVLVERRDDVALEASWGNAGMIAAVHALPWSSTQAPWILLKSLVSRRQPIRFRPSLDWRLWAWSYRFVTQCTEMRVRLNTMHLQRLAAYSQHVLHQTIAAHPLEYDRNSRGIVYLHRSQKLLDREIALLRLREEHGQKISVLDRAGLAELDPSLSLADPKIVGGFHIPSEETGDPYKFATGLASLIRVRGGVVHLNTDVRECVRDGNRITHVNTSAGSLSADAFVLSLGAFSPLLARSLGVRLPIYPVKGYSMTVPIGSHSSPPTVASVDQDYLVAISRFGARIRATTTAEFAGYRTNYLQKDFAYMTKALRELYPDGADYHQAKYWAGLRPMTPGCVPVLGKERYQNLFFNAGHSHMGWTLSHGCARITADLVAGRAPAISMDGLTFE